MEAKTDSENEVCVSSTDSEAANEMVEPEGGSQLGRMEEPYNSGFFTCNYLKFY